MYNINTYHNNNIKNINLQNIFKLKKKIDILIKENNDNFKKIKNAICINIINTYRLNIYNNNYKIISLKKKYYNLSNYIEKSAIFISMYNILPHRDKKKILKEYLLKYNSIIYDELFDKKKLSKSEFICCKTDKISYIDINMGIFQCNICKKLHHLMSNNNLLLEKKKNNLIKTNRYQRYIYYKTYIEEIFLINNSNVPISLYEEIRKKIQKYNITSYIHLKNCISDSYQFLIKKDYIYIYNKYKYNHFDLKNNDLKKMISMFIQIEKIWPKIRGNRRSFISYPYCIYKILELIGIYNNVIKIIEIKHTQKNLEKLDKYWYKICDLLEWIFIPTYF